MLKQPKEILKLAICSDCHHGRRNNSKIHNQDIVNYFSWFCEQVKNEGDVTHIAFLGDWFESRSAINIETLEYSYQNLQQLDSLGLPIFFIVGNHDLHRRTTRDVHSVRMFNELKNFTVIDKPTVIDNILFSPYLFNHEYKDLIQYNDLWAFAGHFEFQNFFITGYNTIMEHGPDHKLFPGPKRIFSGHFHKRQAQDNVIFVGNIFGMDFGDAGDFERGMCFYDTLNDKVEFKNWEEAPTFLKVTLSNVLKNKWSTRKDMKVKCIIDQDVSYTEAQELREAMIEAHQLRDFVLEENREVKQGLLEGDNVKVTEHADGESVDELVVKALTNITDTNIKNIDPSLLVDIYKNLPIDLGEAD